MSAASSGVTPLLQRFGPALVAFAAFLPALGNGFVWDDPIIVERQLTAFGSLGDVFFFDPKIDQISHLYYRPFVFLTLLLDNALGGGHPLPFHLSVVVYHALATLVVTLFIAAVLEGRPQAQGAAAIGGLLFAVHPIHTEAVAWIAGRTDTLTTLFGTLSLYLFLRARRRASIPWGIASGGTFFVALLCKETSISLLPVFLLLEGHERFLRPNLHDTPEGQPRRKRKRQKKVQQSSPDLVVAMTGTLTVVATVVYFVLRRISLPGTIEAKDDVASLGTMVVRLLEAIAYYTKDLLFPYPPNAYIAAYPTGPLWSAATWVVPVALVAVAGFLIARKEWIPLGALASVYITLSPNFAIVIFKISETPFAERYLYLPSVFFCLFVGALLRAHLLATPSWRRSPQLRFGFGAGVAVLCVGLVVYNVYRTRIWQDDYAFWEYHHQINPTEGLPRMQWGTALAKANENDRAREELLAALDLTYDNDGYAMVCNNLAGIAFREQDLETAEKWCRRALEFRSDASSPLFHLGLIHLIRAEERLRADQRGVAAGLLEEARGFFERSLETNPYHARASFGLGKVFFYFSRDEQAIRYLEQAIRLAPNAPEAAEARRLLQNLRK